MVSVEDTWLSALLSKFIDEAQKASCVIHQARTCKEAIETVLNLFEGDITISSWHLEHIPIPGISETFENADITCVGEDENVRVGLTGVDAALAATGNIVLLSGSEKIRNQLYILNRRPIGLRFFFWTETKM